MSRIDYITIGLVVVCLGVLGFVLFKVATINRPIKEPNLIIETPIDTSLNDLQEANSSLDSIAKVVVQKSDSLHDLISEEQPDNQAIVDNPNANFLVVAASFKQMSDAEEELEEIQGLGYSEAEIGLFNGGAIISIIVGRYNSYSTADQRAKELRDRHGLKPYVHQKRE